MFGDNFDAAQEHARMLSERDNLTIIPPFDHRDVIIGQGTVGMEISRQMRGQIHAIFVPVGGGGLLAGVASFYKLVFPGVSFFSSFLYERVFVLIFVSNSKCRTFITLARKLEVIPLLHIHLLHIHQNYYPSGT